MSLSTLEESTPSLTSRSSGREVWREERAEEEVEVAGEEVVAVEAVEALLVPVKIAVSSNKDSSTLLIIFDLYF